MSKNNQNELLRKMQPQRQHYGLRKLSIGVASVLLGTTLYLGAGNVAHADTVASSTTNGASVSASISNETTVEATNSAQATVSKNQSNNSSVAGTVAHADSPADTNTDTTLTASISSQEQTGNSDQTVTVKSQDQTDPQSDTDNQANNNQTNQQATGTTEQSGKSTTSSTDKKTSELTDAAKTVGTENAKTASTGTDNGKNTTTRTLKTNLQDVLSGNLFVSLVKSTEDKSTEDKEVTTTLKFVDSSTGNTILTKTVHGKKGETLYEALGNKTIYDLILEDYPEYFSWDDTKFQNAIDINTGDFKDTSDGKAAKQALENWKNARSHPTEENDDGEKLFGYIVSGSPNDGSSIDLPEIQKLAGLQKIDNSTVEIKLVKNTLGYIFKFVPSTIQRPIGYYKNTDMNSAVSVDLDASTYSVLRNNGQAPDELIIIAGQDRKAVYKWYSRGYDSEGNFDLVGGDSPQVASVYVYYPGETQESREKYTSVKLKGVDNPR